MKIYVLHFPDEPINWYVQELEVNKTEDKLNELFDDNWFYCKDEAEEWLEAGIENYDP